MSRAHPLAGERPLPVEALGDQRLIAFPPGSSTRQVVDAALNAAGVQPTIVVEASELALVRSLVAYGLGIAILPRSFVERPGPGVSFRPLSPALRMTVALWWQRGRRLSPAARAFVAFADSHRPGADVKQPAPDARHPRQQAGGRPGPRRASRA
jgi:DNA-binding transcriptional LysR family regulator